MRPTFKFIGTLLVLGLISSCGKDDVDRFLDEFYLPIIKPEDFVDTITNPLMPLRPGSKFTYHVQTDEGQEINEVTVTTSTEKIMGVICSVITDIVKNDKGDLVENTADWYAQDNEGNVWYFGENTSEYENGKVVSTEGTWRAGVNGAQPGIIMPGKLMLGIPYRQEYLFNEAEDMAKVISTTETVTVPFGTFTNCIETEEWTPLEPGVVEHKYYATGIGYIKSVMTIGGNEVAELISMTN